MNRKKIRLGDIASYVRDKIKCNKLTLSNYVTTDSLLQNKSGRTYAMNVPASQYTVTHFLKDDILVSNIRPYLKKVWFADCDGGCSSDVLVFRAKAMHSPQFLHYALMQDSFFEYVMKGAKGSKMPRGDKSHTLSFPVPNLDFQSEYHIASVLSSLDRKIALNRAINHNLRASRAQSQGAA